MNLLLVEDNQPLAHWLHKLLTEQGFAVELADNGAAADQLLAQRRYQLVLLDLSLPGLSGRAVLRRLRARGDDTPVLVLTASDDLDQKVDCLDLGADDYVTKPVEMRELAARIRVLIRRRLPGKANTLACGRLGYSLQTHQFTLDDAPFALPPRERALLETLMLQQGSAVSKQVLLDGLGDPLDEPSADAIELYVSRLRRKLAGSGAAITTLRGVGYLLREAPDELSDAPRAAP